MTKTFLPLFAAALVLPALVVLYRVFKGSYPER